VINGSVVVVLAVVLAACVAVGLPAPFEEAQPVNATSTIANVASPAFRT
jgi:hypothetical protein